MSLLGKKGAALAASVGTLALVLAGCGASTGGSGNQSSNSANGQNQTTGQKPVEGGSVTLDMIQNIRDLDPAFAYDSQSWEVVTQLYDQLVTWKGDTTQIIPMAAKSYDVSKDGLTYTFHLRKGMKFWNGDPVTAQSFIDEFYRVLAPKMGSGGQGFYEIIQGADKYAAGKSKTIPGLSAPDPYTLVIKLSKPEAFFLQTLTMPFASAVDKKFIESVGNHQVYTKNPTFDSTQAMGSGPFELQTINSNQIVLKKNPDYWRTDSYGQKLPYLDKITFNINNNDQVDSLHFEQGQTAWIGWNFGGDGIPTSSYPQFMSNPNLKKLTVSAVQNSIQYLGLNTKLGPTKNKLVRQAIEYAIDKQAIIKLNNGRGKVANQPLPPGVVGYDSNLSPQAQYTYNPNKAKQLLQEGLQELGLKELPVVTFVGSDSDTGKLWTQAITDAITQVLGIKFKLVNVDFKTRLDMYRKSQFDMTLAGWGADYDDPETFMSLFDCPTGYTSSSPDLYKSDKVDWAFNDPHWCNDEYTNLDKSTQTTNDNTARMQAFAKMEQIIRDEIPIAPMFWPARNYVEQPWVKGIVRRATGADTEWKWAYTQGRPNS
ncbi:MAG: peptide ABC transporter substrate-binding protein [Alicyclobacillus herbarius]|uniref:peptide ABC transporter substrate-binding protein n=1 Tax=Alicyclobacillus herbarius TaxID=122960 RepID=UPI00235404F9|nr:peptide ABC transporter substrate-binding protein [Alicyclobacillus herbarius]MCL6632543.1 peptide ABC transporter substrate-binding protein [Alicyclobacillus herbarius]